MIGESAWAKREEIVKDQLASAADQKTFLKFVEGVAVGKKTKFLLKELGLTWPGFTSMLAKRQELKDLYSDARAIGEELRQVLREDEADRRAVDGVERPVYHKGEVVGYIKEYSDQMLALQLKAGNPDKYAERKQVDVKGVMLNLNIEGVRRETDVTGE